MIAIPDPAPDSSAETQPVPDYSGDNVLLKWGSLKGWRVTHPDSVAALERYLSDPVSLSAMAQRDTAAQRQALLDLIESVAAHGGEIQNDWDGEKYTVEQARDYLENYGRG